MRTIQLKLRDVEDQDCQDIYDWRTHPLVCQNSFNSAAFSYADHEAWFQRKRQSPETTIYIAFCDDQKVGVVRFEDEKQSVNVSVMLNPQFIGQGLGGKLIELGVKRLKEQKQSQKPIIAEIKEDNFASIKAFEKAGFKKSHVTYVFKSGSL